METSDQVQLILEDTRDYSQILYPVGVMLQHIPRKGEEILYTETDENDDLVDELEGIVSKVSWSIGLDEGFSVFISIRPFRWYESFLKFIRYRAFRKRRYNSLNERAE